ncbi:MAG TPA: DEAD/DEAH box helicase [Candidatus Babeliales bacterium]|jgi:ATP-dependent RNA helicase DeaD|nr:DEAD/DEAH box helicase [Candidatus Babeliales bacterium]
MSIQALGVDERLVKAVSELGFTQPTAIQEKAIPLLLQGDRDLIGLAQTGTGKTAAFGLPLISAVMDGKTQGLVICPTRELCLQITKELTSYAKYVSGVNVVAVYGGADIRTQVTAIRRGAHIIVGTPGRLIDHIKRKTITLEKIGRVVLDEADQMLDMGFQEDIDEILKSTPRDKKIWLFSATMQPKIEKIAHTYMSNPIQITVGSRNSGATNIEHQYCVVRGVDIYSAVRRFIDLYPDMFGIVFCRTKRDTQEMSSQLISAGYSSDALHGDLSQPQRDAVMKKFRDKKIQVLIATDVAARGIDVDGVTHVLHCNLPDDIENYTHRSGRTARAGKSGVSIIIGTSLRKIKMIEQQLGITVKPIQVPTGDQLCQKQLDHFAQKLIETSVSDVIKPHLTAVHESLALLTKEEIIERIFALECTETLLHYKKSPNLSSAATSYDSYRDRDSGRAGWDRGDSSRGRRTNFDNASGSRFSGSNRDEARLFINVGKIDYMNKESLIKFITTTSAVDGSCVSRVSMQNTRSFFTVEDNKKAQAIVKTLKDTTLKGRRIQIEFEPSR